MSAPAPNSLMPMPRVGNFSWTLSAHLLKSDRLALYQPSYLLNAMICEYQFDGCSSLPATAQVLGRVGSSVASSSANWLTRLVVTGPGLRVISLKMPQHTT